MPQFTGAVHRIQCPCRSLQIPKLVSIMPYIIPETCISKHLSLESSGIEFFFIVIQAKSPGQNFQLFLRLLHLKLHRREISVDNSLCRPVLENSVLAVFQTYQPLSQHSNPVFIPLQDILSVCFRSCRQLIQFFHVAALRLLINKSG